MKFNELFENVDIDSADRGVVHEVLTSHGYKHVHAPYNYTHSGKKKPDPSVLRRDIVSVGWSHDKDVTQPFMNKNGGYNTDEHYVSDSNPNNMLSLYHQKNRDGHVVKTGASIWEKK